MTAGTVAMKKLCDSVKASATWMTKVMLGSSEAAVKSATRIEWVKFKECSKVLYGKCFSLRLKEKVCQSWFGLVLIA